MTNEITQISKAARQAVQMQDWATVNACANEILRREENNAEGHFLSGLFERVSQRPAMAAEAFEKALSLDPERYDAAVELANQYSIARRNGDAAALLKKYEDKLENSPMYLDLAGTVYSEIGLPANAWPLYQKATALQPGVDLFQANLAACSVYLGKIDEGKEIYRSLLQRFPEHRRNHYQLSRLGKATDSEHIDQMKSILEKSDVTPDKNIFMYYALGKELEDLGRWDESFEFYKKAGDAVNGVAEYDVAFDEKMMDRIIEICDADWLSQSVVNPDQGSEKPDTSEPANSGSGRPDKTPIFIVGLPRTGTTLTERIISSHSQVESVGETQFLQMVMRRESGVQSIQHMNPEMIETAAVLDINRIAQGYMDSISYRLGEAPFFIDKLPFNFLFLGFIAKAWPNARIVHLRRNPMDSCFSMYKQVFTWAYKFSYSLEGLGRYYVAYERLNRHWRTLLKDRMIEVEYENLVTDQENQTRILLDKLGLDFEEDCLNFDQNKTPSATASSVQVREKVHSRSVNKWTYYAEHLQPLKDHLEKADITVEQ